MSMATAAPSLNELLVEAKQFMENLRLWCQTDNVVLRHNVTETLACLPTLVTTMERMSFLVVSAGLAHPVKPGVGYRTMLVQEGDMGRVVPLTFVQVASPPPASPAIPLQDRNLLAIPSSPPVARRRRRSSVKRSQTKKIMDKIKKFV